MKIMSLVILASIVVAVGYAQAPTPVPLQVFPINRYNVPEYRKVELLCALCGRTLYEHQRVEVVPDQWSYDSDPYFGSGAWMESRREQIPDSLRPVMMKFAVESSKVCPRCYGRYRFIIENLQEKWNAWWQTAMADNADVRAVYDELRHQEAVRQAQEAVRKAQQELRWIEHPEERPVPTATQAPLYYGVSDTVRATSMRIVRFVDSVGCGGGYVYPTGSDSLKAKP